MMLSENGPSNISHLRAPLERRVQPLTGNSDLYLSADFVLIYRVFHYDML